MQSAVENRVKKIIMKKMIMTMTTRITSMKRKRKGKRRR
jgi:hypothetical protein